MALLVVCCHGEALKRALASLGLNKRMMLLKGLMMGGVQERILKTCFETSKKPGHPTDQSVALVFVWFRAERFVLPGNLNRHDLA